MNTASIAYFSMEIGLSDDMPTYSGGLGVLAGDTLRAGADWGLPLVAVTLIHRKGYFRQQLTSAGDQTELPATWDVASHLEEMSPRVAVELSGTPVLVRCWKKNLYGVLGDAVPIYFLDTDLPENSEEHRVLTDRLYGGDDRYRLSQEVLLGVGGVRMLQALGYDGLRTFHMNEGHSALLTLELLTGSACRRGRSEPSVEDIAHVKDHCVFTTHTPVKAGHDRFELSLVEELLGAKARGLIETLFDMTELNMTELALKQSRYVNGVARKHGEVSRGMFNGHHVDAITNGVHAVTWAAPPFQELFDKHVPGWREDNQSLRYVAYVPLEEVAAAHQEAKRALLERIHDLHGWPVEEDVFTIGFARRAAAYKRGDLLFQDLERLKRIAKDVGPLQLVYAGKAHPADGTGKSIIRHIVGAASELGDAVRLVYLENYGMEIGALMTAGCDLWLNTPERPKEASGTSGMKAALNGVPSLSVLDGWWIEGHIEGVTGWSIGDHDPSRDAGDLYQKLESIVMPLYYRERTRYQEVMRHTIALNGSFFNTERMMSEYARQAYRMSEQERWREGKRLG